MKINYRPKKIILSFALIISSLALIFTLASFFAIQWFQNYVKRNEVVRTFEIIKEYVLRTNFEISNDFVHKTIQDTQLPGYIVFSIWTNDTEQKITLMSNDPMLPPLQPTGKNKNGTLKTKKLFLRNFFTNDNLDLIYCCSRIYNDTYLQCAIYTDTQNNILKNKKRFFKLIAIFFALTIPFFIGAIILAESYAKRILRLENDYNREKQFTADVSHELKTPLSVIIGYTELLQRWGKDDPELLAESLQMIHEEAVSMNTLVQNLLLLSQTENTDSETNMQIEITALNVKNIFEHQAAIIKLLYPETVVEIDCSDDAIFECDEKILKEVINIIVTNSQNHSPEKCHITFFAKTNTIEISDKGEGISEEDLPHIFERFYRADKSRSRETGGTGLGLSIAKNLLSLCGCSIEARSILGEGTTITIRKES